MFVQTSAVSCYRSESRSLREAKQIYTFHHFFIHPWSITRHHSGRGAAKIIVPINHASLPSNCERKHRDYRQADVGCVHCRVSGHLAYSHPANSITKATANFENVTIWSKLNSLETSIALRTDTISKNPEETADG